MIFLKNKLGDRFFAHDDETGDFMELEIIKVFKKFEGKGKKPRQHKSEVIVGKVVDVIKTGNGKKPWTRKYAQCRGCGTTERSHQGQGYCSKCYQHNHKGGSAKVEKLLDYECLDCFQAFKSSRIEDLRDACPRCSGAVRQK